MMMTVMPRPPAAEDSGLAPHARPLVQAPGEDAQHVRHFGQRAARTLRRGSKSRRRNKSDAEMTAVPMGRDS